MKPLEILSALPSWAAASADSILDSPAFAMQCRPWGEDAILRFDAVCPAETLDVAVSFENEQHVLCLARSARFPELNAIWESRMDVPEPILLALVEKDCGPLFQLLENTVRRQLKLVGIAANAHRSQMLFAQVAEVSFAITRSQTIVTAFGQLRNLDLSHPAVRSVSLHAETEYAAFTLSPADLAGLEVGDAILMPEIGAIPPRLIVDGRFVLDANGVTRYAEDALVRVREAQDRVISLGEIFDSAESPVVTPAALNGAQIRLARNGQTIASGRLDSLADQPAFMVESIP